MRYDRKNLKEGGKLANVTLTWSHHQSPSGKHSNRTRCQIWGSFESHCGSKMNELVSVFVFVFERLFETEDHSYLYSGDFLKLNTSGNFSEYYPYFSEH